MQEDKQRSDRQHDGKAEVNPAARHDDPQPAPEDEPAGKKQKQVPPVQEEPLDPLGPGGIGP